MSVEGREIVVDADNRFTIRVNAWDERAFCFRVTEILGLRCTDPGMVGRIDEENRALGARLCCLRQASDDMSAKKTLLSGGFYVAESSVRVLASFKRLKTKAYFSFHPAELEHLPALQQMARVEFRYSRFHEDPFIDGELADRRYEQWVTDMVARGQCRVALNASGDIIGFYSHRVEADTVVLVLAALSSRLRGYGHFLFSSIIDSLKGEGERVSLLASTANRDILNIYFSLGFSIEQSFLDYHKWY